MAGVDELTALHTALIDARHGYDEAIKDAETPNLKALFEKVRALHVKAHEAVHDLLTARGEAPDESGSFMSTVHETVIGVRSAVVGLDKGSLPSFASGEEHTVSKYENAIAATPDAAQALGTHLAALKAAIIEMRDLA